MADKTQLGDGLSLQDQDGAFTLAGDTDTHADGVHPRKRATRRDRDDNEDASLSVSSTPRNLSAQDAQGEVQGAQSLTFDTLDYSDIRVNNTYIADVAARPAGWNFDATTTERTFFLGAKTRSPYQELQGVTTSQSAAGDAEHIIFARGAEDSITLTSDSDVVIIRLRITDAGRIEYFDSDSSISGSEQFQDSAPGGRSFTEGKENIGKHGGSDTETFVLGGDAARIASLKADKLILVLQDYAPIAKESQAAVFDASEIVADPVGTLQQDGQARIRFGAAFALGDGGENVNSRTSINIFDYTDNGDASSLIDRYDVPTGGGNRVVSVTWEVLENLFGVDNIRLISSAQLKLPSHLNDVAAIGSVTFGADDDGDSTNALRVIDSLAAPGVKLETQIAVSNADAANVSDAHYIYTWYRINNVGREIIQQSDLSTPFRGSEYVVRAGDAGSRIQAAVAFNDSDDNLETLQSDEILITTEELSVDLERVKAENPDVVAFLDGLASIKKTVLSPRFETLETISTNSERINQPLTVSVETLRKLFRLDANIDTITNIRITIAEDLNSDDDIVKSSELLITRNGNIFTFDSGGIDSMATSRKIRNITITAEGGLQFGNKQLTFQRDFGHDPIIIAEIAFPVYIRIDAGNVSPNPASFGRGGIDVRPIFSNFFNSENISYQVTQIVRTGKDGGSEPFMDNKLVIHLLGSNGVRLNGDSSVTSPPFGVIHGNLPFGSWNAVTIRATNLDNPSQAQDIIFNIIERDYFDFETPDDYKNALVLTGTDGADRFAVAEASPMGNFIILRDGNNYVAGLSDAGYIDTIVIYAVVTRNSEGVLTAIEFEGGGNDIYGAAPGRNFELETDRLIFVVTEVNGRATGYLNDADRKAIYELINFSLSEGLEDQNKDLILQDQSAAVKRIILSNAYAENTGLVLPDGDEKASQIVDLFGVIKFAVLGNNEFVQPNLAPHLTDQRGPAFVYDAGALPNISFASFFGDFESIISYKIVSFDADGHDFTPALTNAAAATAFVNAGLSLDAATGRVSGTLEAGANYAITIRATDKTTDSVKPGAALHIDYAFSLTATDVYNFDTTIRRAVHLGDANNNAIELDRIGTVRSNIAYLKETTDSLPALSNEGIGVVDTIIIRLTQSAAGTINFSDVAANTTETYGGTDGRDFEFGTDRLIFVLTQIGGTVTQTLTHTQRQAVLEELIPSIATPSPQTLTLYDRAAGENNRKGVTLNDALPSTHTDEAHVDTVEELIALFGAGNLNVVGNDEIILPTSASPDNVRPTFARHGIITTLTHAYKVESGIYSGSLEGFLPAQTEAEYLLGSFSSGFNDGTDIVAYHLREAVRHPNDLSVTQDGRLRLEPVIAIVNGEPELDSNYRYVFTYKVFENGLVIEAEDKVAYDVARRVVSAYAVNFAPHLTQAIPTSQFANRSFTIDLDDYFDDINTDNSLTYEAKFDDTFLTINSDNKITIELIDGRLSAGTLTLTATDNHIRPLARDDRDVVPDKNEEIDDPASTIIEVEFIPLGLINPAPMPRDIATITDAEVNAFLTALNTLKSGDEIRVTDVILAKLFTGISSVELAAASDLFAISVPSDIFTVTSESDATTNVATYIITAQTQPAIRGGNITITASDGLDVNEDIAVIELGYNFNTPPEFDTMGERVFMRGAANFLDIDVGALFSDADEDSLTYRIVSVTRAGQGVTVREDTNGIYIFDTIKFTGSTAIFSAVVGEEIISGAAYEVHIAADDGDTKFGVTDGSILIVIGDILPIRGVSDVPSAVPISFASTLRGEGKLGNFVYTDNVDVDGTDEVIFYIAHGGAPASGAADARVFHKVLGKNFSLEGMWGSLTVGETGMNGKLEWSYLADFSAHVGANKTDIFTVRVVDNPALDNRVANYVEEFITVNIAEEVKITVDSVNLPNRADAEVIPVISIVPPARAMIEADKVSLAGYKKTGNKIAEREQFIITDQAPDVIDAGRGKNLIYARRGIDEVSLASADAVDTIYYKIDATSSSWLAYDGADTIRNFQLGTDKLVFTFRVSEELAAKNAAISDASARAAARDTYYDVRAADKVILRIISGETDAMISGIELFFAASGDSFGGISTGNVLTINFAENAPISSIMDASGLAVLLQGRDGADMVVDNFIINFEAISANNVAEVASRSELIDAIAVARVGMTISVDLNQISDGDGVPAGGTDGDAFSYQWLRLDSVGLGDDMASFALINESETGATYTPAAADIGDFIRVIVSFRDVRGNTESVSSDAVRIIPAPAPAAPLAESYYDDSAPALDDDAPPPLDML